MRKTETVESTEATDATVKTKTAEEKSSPSAAPVSKSVKPDEKREETKKSNDTSTAPSSTTPVAASKVAKNVTPAVTLNSVVLVKDPEKSLVVGAGVVEKILEGEEEGKKEYRVRLMWPKKTFVEGSYPIVSEDTAVKNTPPSTPQKKSENADDVEDSSKAAVETPSSVVDTPSSVVDTPSPVAKSTKTSEAPTTTATKLASQRGPLLTVPLEKLAIVRKPTSKMRSLQREVPFRCSMFLLDREKKLANKLYVDKIVPKGEAKYRRCLSLWTTAWLYGQSHSIYVKAKQAFLPLSTLDKAEKIELSQKSVALLINMGRGFSQLGQTSASERHFGFAQSFLDLLVSLDAPEYVLQAKVYSLKLNVLVKLEKWKAGRQTYILAAKNLEKIEDEKTKIKMRRKLVNNWKTYEKEKKRATAKLKKQFGGKLLESKPVEEPKVVAKAAKVSKTTPTTPAKEKTKTEVAVPVEDDSSDVASTIIVVGIIGAIAAAAYMWFTGGRASPQQRARR